MLRIFINLPIYVLAQIYCYSAQLLENPSKINLIIDTNFKPRDRLCTRLVRFNLAHWSALIY